MEEDISPEREIESIGVKLLNGKVEIYHHAHSIHDDTEGYFNITSVLGNILLLNKSAIESVTIKFVEE